MGGFWAFILVVLGIILLGIGIVAGIDAFADPNFAETKYYRELFMALLFVIGGLAAISAGVGKAAPKSKIGKIVSWETPTEKGFATYTE